LKKYPDFVKKGAYRGGDAMFPATLGSFDKKYGGYYTQDELRSIVAYATERNIEVIPEIDMPGHSRILGLIHPAIRCNYTPDTSATNGMDMRNVWCVAKESNYTLIEDIVKELVEIFPSEYIHIGGDEVRFEQWDGCADCQKLIKEKGLTGGAQLEQFFVNRVSKILAKYNRKSMVWDEAVDGGLLPKSTLVCGWRKFGIGWQVSTKNGYPTIVMPGEFMYLNRKQSPYDRGHLPVCSFKTMCEFSFDNADATDEQRKHIAGIEAGFWSETHLVNITPDRHFSDYLEYMFFPRTLAVSELGWSKERRSFDEMISILKESFYYKLSAMGVTYRLEDPIIKVENGKIYASTTDGSELYYRDILTNKTRKYRTPIDASKASFTLFQSRMMTGYSEEVGAEEFYNSLKPKCTITSSMPFSEKYTAERCASYEKAARITCSAGKGDWVEWRFEEPLKCTYIKIATGVEHMRYCVINNGHLEVSYDGKTFVNVGALNDGGFELQPKNKPIYAIRIVSDGTNEAIGRTDIQPLIIK
jgi:hexosaminidase